MLLIFIGLLLGFSNGFIIQFGAYNTLSSNVWVTITFPSAWKSSLYSVNVTQRNDGYTTYNFAATCVGGFQSKTETTCKMGFRYLLEMSQAYISWIAIGF